MNVRSPNCQSDAAAGILALKRVIPALLLTSVVLPMGTAAQEPSTAASPEGVAMDELLGEIAPAEQEGQAAEPAPASAAPQDTAGQETTDAPPAPAASFGESLTAGIAAEGEQPKAAELDVIPVPEREPEPPVVQKEAPRGRQLEEIVVTAQKREQMSQDVPISMSVLNETFIREQGITDIGEALRFVPNFKVIEFGNKISPQCRGFTVDDSNPAFEPPCGVALDGVAFTRAAFFSNGLFDISRMEVLRGPQGTTFGKNTTAGIVGLYSREPTDEFGGKIDLSYGVAGPSQRRLEAAFGGPLIADVVNFRLAGVVEKRDGYMQNTYHDVDPSVPPTTGGRERTSYRATLVFPDVLGSTIKLLHERSDYESSGMTVKVYAEDGSASERYIHQYDPNADLGDNYKTSIVGPQIVPTTLVRNHLEWSREFGDWSVTALGAFGELTTAYRIVPAPYPVRWIVADRSERDPFLTGEVRAASPDFEGLFGLKELFGMDLGSSRFLAGLFAQQTQIKDLHLRVTYNEIPTVGLLASGLGVFVPDALANRLLQMAAGQDAVTEWADLNFDQTAQNQAVFGQFTWDMTEKWSLDLGGRLSAESKVGDWNTYYSRPAPILDNTGDGGFTAHRKIRETTFQPKISLGYKPIPEVNLYLHWAQAFKSGGFNFYTITGDPEKADPPGSLTFDPESATDWGFDIKTSLLDNTLRFNLSLFRLDLRDFQVLTEVAGTNVLPANTIPGTGSANVPNNYQEVRNAASARAQGVEIDVQSLPTDWLTVTAALGYNDTEYLSFPGDSCGADETPDPETNLCDHSGKGFKNSPKLSGSLNLDTRFALAGMWAGFGGLELTLGGGFEYVGKTYLSPSEDPRAVRDPYYLYRGSLGLSNALQGWSFRLLANNLLDDYILASRTYGPEPVGGKRFGAGGPLPPRTVTAMLNWNF